MIHTDKKFIVYMHTTPCGKRYVGITSVSPAKRWGHNGSRYIYAKNREITHFGRAIMKYGWDNILHEIISSDLSREDACNLEKELIKEYKTDNWEHGYNKTSGGESFVFTEEVKKHMFRWTSEREYPEEARKKLSEFHKGRKHSKEHIEKMRQTKLSMHIHLTEEQKEHLSKINKGKKYPKGEHINSGCFKKGHVGYNKGKNMSDEFRTKIKEGIRKAKERKKNVIS